jgi:hypothetical protein
VRATVVHGAGDVRIEDVPDAYRATADREALKVVVRPHIVGPQARATTIEFIPRPEGS